MQYVIQREQDGKYFTGHINQERSAWSENVEEAVLFTGTTLPTLFVGEQVREVTR